MSVKNRPDSARQELRRQAAQVRRGAPGKRFIGGTAEQSSKARRAQSRKVARMAKANAAARREEERLAAARAEAMPEPVPAPDLEALGAAAPMAVAAVEAFPAAHPMPSEAAAPRPVEPISAILMGLVADAFQLARSLALAPFQIARAFLRPAEV